MWGWSQDGSVSRTVGISSQKHIFLKIQKKQLSLKERPEDIGQQPDHIHTRENPAPGERGKIQSLAQRDPNAPHPSSWQEERSWSGEGEGAQDC